MQLRNNGLLSSIEPATGGCWFLDDFLDLTFELSESVKYDGHDSSRSND
jgi:hypothetical protein